MASGNARTSPSASPMIAAEAARPGTSRASMEDAARSIPQHGRISPEPIARNPDASTGNRVEQTFDTEDPDHGRHAMRLDADEGIDIDEDEYDDSSELGVFEGLLTDIEVRLSHLESALDVHRMHIARLERDRRPTERSPVDFGYHPDFSAPNQILIPAHWEPVSSAGSMPGGATQRDTSFGGEAPLTSDRTAPSRPHRPARAAVEDLADPFSSRYFSFPPLPEPDANHEAPNDIGIAVTTPQDHESATDNGSGRSGQGVERDTNHSAGC